MCCDLWMWVRSWGNDLMSLPALSGTCRSQSCFRPAVKQNGSGFTIVAIVARAKSAFWTLFCRPICVLCCGLCMVSILLSGLLLSVFLESVEVQTSWKEGLVFFFSLLNPCFQFFLNLTHKHCFKRYVTEAPNKDRLIFFLKYMWLKFETWLLPSCSLWNRKLAQERGCCSGGNAGGNHPAGGNADFHNLAPCMRDHPILSS